MLKHEKFYRYEDKRHCSIDEFDDINGSYVKIYLLQYDVIKKTPKGVWISYSLDFNGNYKKFILLTARKKYANSTKEKALNDYLYRKKRQVQILKSRLNNAKDALYEGEKIKKVLEIT